MKDLEFEDGDGDRLKISPANAADDVFVFAIDSEFGSAVALTPKETGQLITYLIKALLKLPPKAPKK